MTFLDTADRIGARLCRDAIWFGQRCNWIGEYGDHPSAMVHQALGPSLYNGTSGVALFLFQLFEATGEKIFSATAEGALQQALSQPREGIGLHAGAAGVAFAAARAGRKEEAIEIVRGLAPNASQLDVIEGSAGVIPVLLSLNLLEAATGHGQLLVEQAVRTDEGWSWKSRQRHHRNLTGFAHGTAGISWALLELFQITGEEKFRCAALEGLRYERSFYRAEEENWPDFRNFSGGEPNLHATFPCLVQWCHGAPGIGFSRLRAWQILGDEIYREEALAAIRTTSQSLRDASRGNYSLCHGHSGNADLLLYADNVLNCPDYTALARQVGEAGIEKYEAEKIPWPCGSFGDDELPDLMLGLAGIGYFMLRLNDPRKVPSVLRVMA